MENYGQFLIDKAISSPNKVAFIHLLDGEDQKTSITYKELDYLARKIATLLRSKNASGETALLLYPSCIDYIAALFGCFYAGVIAVPLYQPRNTSRAMSRMHTVFEDAQAKFVLSTSEQLEMFKNTALGYQFLNSTELIATDTINNTLQISLTGELLTNEIAYLQYTSGSTGNPKGVMITHSNLIHNSSITKIKWQNDEDSTIVSWLPFHHDMGLIGMIFQAIYSGATCVFMSPRHFIQKPLRWLKAIDKYNAQISGAPNFAYDLCIEKITAYDLIELDLSSWKIAYNAAEPVRKNTIEKFSCKFMPCGFNKNSFYPMYGMAEATLIVTAGILSQAPKYLNVSRDKIENLIIEETTDSKNGREFVSCGSVVNDMQIEIVDTSTFQLVKKNQIGEIWIAGPSNALGYWKNPNETQKIFAANLKEYQGINFFRSGDLGYLKDDQLYIAGRCKDLIIIRGKNYYPSDIEFSAESAHKMLKINDCAAFGVEVDQKECLVIVQTLKVEEQLLPYDQIQMAIRQQIIEDHDIDPYDIVLTTTGQIQKTSSGKVQRSLCKKMYLDSTLIRLN